jgi:hypothetical protein
MLVGKREEKRQSGRDFSVNGRNLKKQLGFYWLRIGPSGGLLSTRQLHFGCQKTNKFLGQLSKYIKIISGKKCYGVPECTLEE